MYTDEQKLGDALAGRVRVSVLDSLYSTAHVRNLLMQAGVPVIWGPGGTIRVRSGRLHHERIMIDDEHVFLWEPMEDLASGIKITMEVSPKRGIPPFAMAYDTLEIP